MQKHLKRPPIFFLGALENDIVLLSLHGETGYIGIENLIDARIRVWLFLLKPF